MFEIVAHKLTDTIFAVYVDVTTGKTLSVYGPLNNVGVVESIKVAAQKVGVEINDVVQGETLELDTQIENWSEYEIFD